MFVLVTPGILTLGLMVVGTSVVCAQNFPNKPIRVVTGEAGGGGDFVARLIAQELSTSLGQQVIVENRPSGTIPGEIVAKATADGHTLLNYGSTLWIGSLLQKTPYDPIRDFSPITLSQSSPCILVISPSTPANSVKDLIALAKAKPGGLNYASVSTGSVTHLAAELFKSMAGIDVVRINYKGPAMAFTDLVAGQVQLMFAVSSSVAPHVKSGRLKALAVTSAGPSSLMPNVPTVASLGLPGYEAVSLNGVLAPARTPAPVINRLNQEIVRILNRSDVKQKFLSSGVEAVGNSSEEFSAKIKSEIAKWGRVMKDAGIRAD